MLWFKKQKTHEPFGNDFNLVTIRFEDPSGPRQSMSYTLPDNWICQLIGATLYSKAGGFSSNNPWIEVTRRGCNVWIIPYAQTLASNVALDICWGVGLENPAVNTTTNRGTAPLPEHCFIEGGDIITFDWLIKAMDDVQKTGTIYLKQWILY